MPSYFELNYPSEFTAIPAIVTYAYYNQSDLQLSCHYALTILLHPYRVINNRRT
ncbi:hypothetical protein JYU34_015310 [Plutella xylostella]|uniref:Uncharacterized protein n=1 Tax=Plutella xylostella TaxID=51655 RepID=A0ABQ7Q6T6_PLUXY|nr:hypothetical protein JYU34_015310 [Plutella xylostella]